MIIINFPLGLKTKTQSKKVFYRYGIDNSEKFTY